MKHVLKVSRHLKGPTEALPIAPLWITDALLNETFNRFSRGCRRHGSHVPGPLEARKRATRRKNTSLAYNGASAAPIDVAGLFGPGQQGGWWQNPHIGEQNLPQRRPGRAGTSSDEATVPLRKIMSWLGEVRAPSTPEPKLEDLEVKTSDHYPLSGIELKVREVAFQEQLRAAQGLDEIRLLVRQQRLDSSQALVFPTLALQHILESKWTIAHIKDFLLDPVLNPPDAKPLRVLGNALKGEWLDQTTRAGLFDLICECVSLGVASPKEVRRTIRSIPSYKMLFGNALGRVGEDCTIHEYYQKILSAISQSKVLSIKDLDNEFMLTWFKDISNRSFTPLGAQLLWDIRQYSALSDIDLANSITSRLLSYDLQDGTIPPQETSLAKFIAVLPPTILPCVLIRAAHSIVSLSDNRVAEGKELPIVRLQGILAGLSDRKVHDIFSSTESWRGCLAESGPPKERAERAAILCWVAVTISRRIEQAEAKLRKLDLRNSFQALYANSGSKGGRDVLAQFLATIQTLALPNTSLVLAQLRFITDDYLVAYNRDFMCRVMEKDLLRKFSLLQNDRDYEHFRIHFNDALVELTESINSDLNLFLRVSRHYIETDESAFRILVRILKHNLALHHTLSQAWPSRIAQSRATAEAPSQLTGDQEYYTADVHKTSPSVGHTLAPFKSTGLELAQTPQKRSQLDPREVLDLINHLAISFATSPVITSRQAVRKVYWCFELLHRYGAPIEPPVTRALWHAGVTRQGQNGTATTLLKWIVQQIRTVEGDNVANMLVRSAGFRQKIEEQFADLNMSHRMPQDDKGHDEILLGELQNHEPVDLEAAMRRPEKVQESQRSQLPDWKVKNIGYRAIWRPFAPGKIGKEWDEEGAPRQPER
jgi:hypothetical protein